jgi:hypothetical protein
MRLIFVAAVGLIFGTSAIGCGVAGPEDDGGSNNSGPTGAGTTTGSGSGGAGSGGSGAGNSVGSGSTLNSDNDACGLTDAEEIAIGSDPFKLDTDGDGIDDCGEVECVSNPADANEKCYACGWKHNDPGNLVSTGNTPGSIIANVGLMDQCGELVDLWDFAREYHILWMTAAW